MEVWDDIEFALGVEDYVDGLRDVGLGTEIVGRFIQEAVSLPAFLWLTRFG